MDGAYLILFVVILAVILLLTRQLRTPLRGDTFCLTSDFINAHGTTAEASGSKIPNPELKPSLRPHPSPPQPHPGEGLAPIPESAKKKSNKSVSFAGQRDERYYSTKSGRILGEGVSRT